MPEHRLSTTIDVSSSCSVTGAPQPPRTGHVWPQPMIRVAVPTGPDAADTGAGAWLTDVPSCSSARSADGCVMIREPRAVEPPLVRLVVPTRTVIDDADEPWTQCFAVTTQLALTSVPPQKWLPLLCRETIHE